MKNLLHELYYGNINPNGKPFKRDLEYSRVIKILSDSEEKLLNDDEKEIFKTFSNAQGDLNEISVSEPLLTIFAWW